MAYMCTKSMNHAECFGCGGCGAKVACVCGECGCDIHVDETYYALAGDVWCVDCVEAAKITAVIDEP